MLAEYAQPKLVCPKSRSVIVKKWANSLGVDHQNCNLCVEAVWMFAYTSHWSFCCFFQLCSCVCVCVCSIFNTIELVRMGEREKEGGREEESEKKRKTKVENERKKEHIKGVIISRKLASTTKTMLRANNAVDTVGRASSLTLFEQASFTNCVWWTNISSPVCWVGHTHTSYDTFEVKPNESCLWRVDNFVEHLLIINSLARRIHKSAWCQRAVLIKPNRKWT